MVIYELSEWIEVADRDNFFRKQKVWHQYFSNFSDAEKVKKVLDSNNASPNIKEYRLAPIKLEEGD